jgi:lipid-A-disaccharide synthase
LKHYPELRRLFRQLLDLAADRVPDCIVLVDYPGFNLRFAKAVKALVRARRQRWFYNWNPRIVYYVSPQLWAWHSSRVHQISRDVDLLLSIFPFEKAWYAQRAPQLRVEFVGHPLVDRYGGRSDHRQPRKEAADKTTAKSKPLIVLLPGSRARELRKHLPPIAAAVPRIEASAEVRWRMVLPNEKLAELARERMGHLPQIEIRVTGLAESLSEATAAIASSGTITMECAWFGIPTVVIYRVSWSTYQLGRRLIRVPHIAMPNLLANRALYLELIQHEVTPERIAQEALALLNDPARRLEIKKALGETVASLGPSGASRRAAGLIQGLWDGTA